MTRTFRRMRERLGVRAASALAAATAVAMVLVVAGIALVMILEHELKRNTEEALLANAQQVAERIEANFAEYRRGDPAKENAVVTTARRTDLVQVVTAWSDNTGAPDSVVGSNGAGRNIEVFASSEPLDGQAQLVPRLAAPHESFAVMDVPVTFRDPGGPGAGEIETENMMVVGLGERVFDRPITIYTAQPTDQLHSAVRLVTLLVVFGVPLLVLVAGGFTYLFAGRALRPVETMRTKVAGMGDKDLSQRVDEPVARDEVGRLARTMNQMLGRIESAQTTQRRFVADASHELRSPLATVSTGLELLGQGMPEGSADRGTVDVLRGEASRLTGLVENLLFLARADERGVAPRREEVDLDEIADAERVRPAAGDAVTVRVVTQPVRVVGDRGQLVRVLRNLVDNARRHASSTVAVSVRADGGLAVVDVDDDGNGVPEADRARVFERFVRLDEARSRGDGGSGLGLSIVSELVAAHGGTVEATSSPELGGARFRVTIPAAAAPLPERDEQSDDAVAAPGGTPEEAAAELCDDRPSGPIPRVAAVPAGAAAPAGAARTEGAGTAGAGAAGADADRARSDGARTDGAGSDGARPDGAGADGAGRTGTGRPEPARPVMGAGPAEPPRRPSPYRTPHPAPVSAPRAGASAGGGPGADGMMRTPGEPGVTHGSDGRAPDGAPVATPPATPDPEDDVSAPPAHSRLDPPTGPLPIRPNTVGSPYDENATRPLPVTPPRGTAGVPGRAGTAVAARGAGEDRPARTPSPRRPFDRRR
ncbi:HAMP domain-containing sensor histidine kinase [Pseudonocardia spirodelae]|uniref:histidine kinase n=1 Tax=Pseudonocardia spirodelae TaxID=3133431 RepID=A0ABU8T6K4_9PSEU